MAACRTVASWWPSSASSGSNARASPIRASAAAAALTIDRSPVEHARQGFGRARIAEAPERRDGGQRHVLIVRLQLLDENADHGRPAAYQRLEHVGPQIGVAEQARQRALDGRPLHPAEEQHERAQLVFVRAADRVENLPCAGRGQRGLELGDDVGAAGVLGFVAGVEAGDRAPRSSRRARADDRGGRRAAARRLPLRAGPAPRPRAPPGRRRRAAAPGAARHADRRSARARRSREKRGRNRATRRCATAGRRHRGTAGARALRSRGTGRSRRDRRAPR